MHIYVYVCRISFEFLLDVLFSSQKSYGKYLYKQLAFTAAKHDRCPLLI